VEQDGFLGGQGGRRGPADRISGRLVGGPGNGAKAPFVKNGGGGGGGRVSAGKLEDVQKIPSHAAEALGPAGDAGGRIR